MLEMSVLNSQVEKNIEFIWSIFKYQSFDFSNVFLTLNSSYSSLTSYKSVTFYKLIRKKFSHIYAFIWVGHTKNFVLKNIQMNNETT